MMEQVHAYKPYYFIKESFKRAPAVLCPPLKKEKFYTIIGIKQFMRKITI